MNTKTTPASNCPDDWLNPLIRAEPNPQAASRAIQNLHQSLEKIKMNAIVYTLLEHPTIGQAFLAVRDEKLIALDFGVEEDQFLDQLEAEFKQAPYYEPEELQIFTRQLLEYLNGQRRQFDLPIALDQLTGFQRQVLMATLQIPRGQIVTYAEIARQIGNPKSVRAVGQALGRNPIPIVIPCHRVIASNGSLGGYSGGGGLETKAKLLQLEGAMLGGSHLLV